MSDPMALGRSAQSEVAGPLVLSIEGSPLAGVESLGDDHGPMLLRFPVGRLEVRAPARVRHGALEFDARSQEARQLLKRAVSSPVTHVALERDSHLDISFEDGTTLVVSLRPEDRNGAEAAAFFDENWAYDPY